MVEIGDRIDTERVVICYCGARAHLYSNSFIYGREFGGGKVWVCEDYPACDGRIGAHPDNRPLGIMCDEETRLLRRKIHSIIDPIWIDKKGAERKKKRGSVYGWLQRITGLTGDDCHVGHFDKQMCMIVLKLIKENPYKKRFKTLKKEPA